MHKTGIAFFIILYIPYIIISIVVQFNGKRQMHDDDISIARRGLIIYKGFMY